MKKKVFGRKLSRSRPAREALFSSLVRSFILTGKIVTTKAKAKSIIGKIERLVSLSKKGGISRTRLVLADLDNKRDATLLLSQKIAPAFSDRVSGFVRVINLAPRKGDNAQLARIEWVKEIDLTPLKKEVKSRPEKVNKKESKSKKTKKEVTKNKK